MDATPSPRSHHREPWNKGKLTGQKAPFKPKDIWAIRIHLQNAHAVRDLAMFNLAIDSKLRGCDLVSLQVAVNDDSLRGGVNLGAEHEPEESRRYSLAFRRGLFQFGGVWFRHRFAPTLQKSFCLSSEL